MTPPPLVLAAHGSVDPRFGAVISALADLVRQLRPSLEVRVGYLEHGPPHLSDIATAETIVVPVLLSSGFHVRTDIPAQAPGVTVAAALGPDRRLARLLRERLVEAGWDGASPVTLAAAGSADPDALDDVRSVAADLSVDLGAAVTAGFLSAGTPRLADLAPSAVALYLLAPGHFADLAVRTGGTVVAEPLGAHPLLAEIILDRYDATRALPDSATR